MTFCFIASVPGVVLAAADTRIGLHHDRGAPVIHDGPGDIPIELETLRRTLVIRYRQRKIRFLGTGWAVIAGDLASGSLVLDELHGAKAARFETAQAHLARIRDALEERALSETGVPKTQQRQTLVIGAELSPVGGVWTLGVDPNDPRTKAQQGQFVANTPQDVPAQIQMTAKQAFFDEVGLSCQSGNAMGLVKAAARFVGVVSRHSKEASARAQIGVTIKGPDTEPVARYFDGAVDDLLRLGQADFLTSSEAAA